MIKIYRINRIVVISCCFVMMLCFIQSSFAQGFLSRDSRYGWGGPYESFSGYDLRKYPNSLHFGKPDTQVRWHESGMTTYYNQNINPAWNGPADYVTFDRFGNFLLPGGDVYNMTWDRSAVGSRVNTNRSVANIFNNLIIATDEISSWQTRFMIATSGGNNGIRAYFTPSTLKVTNMSGIRWDASSRKNNVSFIASIGNGRTSTNTFGAHWQSVLGDVLKLGGTFVVRQRGTQKYNNRDITSGTSGLAETDMPRYIYVIVTDDSPEDATNGARVHDVQAVINGNVAQNVNKRSFVIPDIININKYTGDAWSSGVLFQQFQEIGYEVSEQGRGSNTFERGTDDEYIEYVPKAVEEIKHSGGSWFLGMMGEGGSTYRGVKQRQLFVKYSQGGVMGYLSLPEIAEDGTPLLDDEGNTYGRHFGTDDILQSQGYLDAYGTDVIVYEFLIPSGAREVSFNVLAGNDYCIDLIAAMPQRGQGDYPDWDAQPGAGAWEGSWRPIFQQKHCKKAPGDVSDFSNTGWVRVDYNRLTGMNVYGMDMELNWRGWFVRGEINEYNALWAYPVHDYLGSGSTNTTNARAWFVNFEKDFGKWGFGGELFDYPKEYMEHWAPIDDNDDNNRWTGSSQALFLKRTTDYGPDSGTGGLYTINNYEYPGLNIDLDRIPETRHVDTKMTGEPYISYYIDSISFGDDFNHNGIIDERENDTSADLPYDRDSRGQHYFLKIKPREYTLFTLGHYDVEQEYLNGQNLTDYFKAEHHQRIGSTLEYGLYHRSERVKDDYKSNKYYYQFTALQDPAWGPSGIFNNLAYRDSWVNTSMVKTNVSLIPNLNIINNVLYSSIRRMGDLIPAGTETEQLFKAPREIVKTTSIHKIDYTYRLADFRLLPDIYFRGFRIMNEKRIREFRIQPQFKYEGTFYTANLHTRNNGGHYYGYYPILRVDYRVAPNTLLRLALQGFPGFMEKRRDSGDRLHDVDRRRMFLGFETTTLYQGFNLLVTTGIRRDKQKWIKSYGRREIGETEYFVQVKCEASR